MIFFLENAFATLLFLVSRGWGSKVTAQPPNRLGISVWFYFFFFRDWVFVPLDDHPLGSSNLRFGINGFHLLIVANDVHVSRLSA